MYIMRQQFHKIIQYVNWFIGGMGKLIFSKMYFSVSQATLSLLSAFLLATSGDITMTWTSPVYPKLFSNDTSINPLGRPITTEEGAWIGSLLSIGAIVGPLPFSIIAERFGRKIGLLAIAVPHIIAYLSMAFAKDVYIYYFGRLLGGIGVGGGYTILPMYIAEVSEESKRGVFSVLLGVFWGVGNFLPNAIGPFMSLMWFNVAMALLPITFFVTFLILGYESPYYLVGAKRMAEAEDLLCKIRHGNKKTIKVELKEIQANIETEQGGHLMDIITQPALRKALVISCVLISFQQFSGINAISFYQTTLFEAANTDMSPEIASLIVSFFSLLFSAGTPIIVDRFKRITLLQFSYSTMMISLGFLGVFFYLKDSTDVDTGPLSFMPLSCLLLYIFAFQAGSSTLPWSIPSELFPKNVKQISASATSSACWISSFFVTKYFEDMNLALGRASSFWFFSGCCLLSVLFNLLCVPETHGKTFAEIQDMIKE